MIRLPGIRALPVDRNMGCMMLYGVSINRGSPIIDSWMVKLMFIVGNPSMDDG